MTTENNIEELCEDIEVIGPGQILSEAREAMGLTQQQVAEKLNFRTTLVKDIEKDQFDHSLPATFNRGYLKNYAKLVGVSAEEVLAGYEMLNVAKKQGAEMQSFSKETKKQAENNMVMWISYLILALLIGSTILWWLQDAKKSNDLNNLATPTVPTTSDVLEKTQQTEELSGDVQAPTALSELTQNTEFTTLSETLKSAPGNLLLDEQEHSTANASVANNEVDTANTQQTITPDTHQATTHPVTIDFGPIEVAVFTFSGDCWVNIYDATGERIAWGIKKSGYEMNISGQAPFTVTLGKPELVTIEFENNIVDMSQFSRGNIAKFTLPLS
jgi:cytoskeleton protein RodZ